MQGPPQQRTLPNIHNKDDKYVNISNISQIGLNSYLNNVEAHAWVISILFSILYGNGDNEKSLMLFTEC